MNATTRHWSISIGRRFRNDTERLEKLFELYTKMAAERGGKCKAGAAVLIACRLVTRLDRQWRASAQGVSDI